MTCDEFVKQLREQGIVLWVESDQLRYRALENALSPAILTEIRERKTEILDLFRNQEMPQITYPLALGQRAIWLIDKLDPGNYAYNIPLAFRVQGLLEVDALEKSFNEIIRRHETLRTIFKEKNGDPVQHVAPSMDISLDITDISGASAEEGKEAIQQRITEEAKLPFDLESGPLVRVKLFQVENDDYILFINIHHSVFDGWSFSLLSSELGTLYDAYTSGKPSPLQDLPIQYGEYALWQWQWMQGNQMQAQMSYWKKQLSGELPILQLPTDRPRPVFQTFNGAKRYLSLSKELYLGLQRLGKLEGCTLFITLLSALQTLLFRYSNQEDMIVGSPIANRGRSEFESLIGYFVNMLVIRSDLSGDPSFREVLRRTRKVTLEAYDHQDLPFEKLVEELQPERDVSRNPIFQVVLQVSPKEELKFPGLSVTPLQFESGISPFDITLHLWESPEGLSGYFEYNTDLFDAETIDRWIAHYRILLESVVEDADRPVARLPLLTEAESELLLGAWSGAGRSFPISETLAQRFEAQVERTPNAVALTLADEELTYAELNRAANRVAHRLHIGPNALVGLFCEKSIDLVVGLLGIIKTGGAYLPLDPALPEERLRFMLGDAGISVVLTRSSEQDRLPSGDFSTVLLDEPGDAPDHNPASQVTPGDIAYVIYTSGSTGKPKGVLVTHANVLRLFDATDEWFGFGDDEVWTLFHSYAFDFSVWEIWGALLYGGRLVIVPYTISRSPTEFGKLLTREKVTILNQTPSAFQQLIHVDITLDPSLRLVIFGGEALELRSLAPWIERHGDEKPRLVNMYGITETTVHVTYRPILADDVRHGQRGVIGVPIPDVSIHILDKFQQPVPIGVTGELYVGGAGVSRGYLNRPELTAERFVGGLYRTGDLGRFLPNQDIEYIGRIDNQVQLRGFRVELGEIETVLADHPWVRESVIVADNDRLVAYIVPESLTEPPIDELREFLRNKLPAYMVPAAFMVLESIPLTHNGKIDRKSLPKPEGARQISADFVTPEGDLEEMIADIWKEVLGIDKVGVHDNFFDLGGHSLLANQVISRIRDRIKIELPLRILFQKPTVAALAERIEMMRNECKASADLPPIKRISREGNLPLSYEQQSLWFLDQLEGSGVGYNIPMAMRIKGALDYCKLQQALDTLVARHESLRITFVAKAGNPVQVIAEELTVPVTVETLTGALENQAKERLKNLSQVPFDLSDGPLLRVTLLRLGDNEHILLLLIHHIVSDGWSMGVLSRELTALYDGFCLGKPVNLPELTVQYADYAVWQRDWFSGEELQRQVGYWKKRLRGAPPLLKLPTDGPRPAVQSYRGSIYSKVLSPELTMQIKILARQHGCTLFMVMLAAFDGLLARWMGKDDIVVGTPIAGRQQTELEGLIGFFINTLVMRIDVSGDPSFVELLDRVKQVTLEAYDHQGLPFDKLVEVLQPQRSLSYPPIVQVMFNLHNEPFNALSPQNLVVSSVEIEYEMAKYDLNIHLEEQGNRLSIVFSYSTDLFNRRRIEEMLAQYQQLLAQVVERPDKPLSCFSLLTTESQSILPNPTLTLDSAWEVAVQTRFSDQAARVPDRPAILDRLGSCTYQELEAGSNQLANYLLEKGLKSEEIVAIYGHRSASLVWALLGVLKAGAAFLILDPDYPVSRLLDCLGLAKPRGWLQLTAAGDLPDELKTYVAGSPLCCRLELPDRWTGEDSPLSGYSDVDPRVIVEADDLAYIAFTSGSTGKPKGILGTHRPLSHFIDWHTRTFAFTEEDRFSMLSGLSHDPLLRDIFTPLWMGASVVIPHLDILDAPEQLVNWLIQGHISVVHLTPAMGALLTESAIRVDASDTQQLVANGLRYAFFGGDELRSGQVEKFRKLAPAVCVVNFYGATETPQVMGYTVVSDDASRGDNKDFASGSQSIPLGKGITDVQLLVLNRTGQMAGVGELGEINVRTPYLARGYLNNEPTGSGRFSVNPFTDKTIDRLYKTGDLGRYLPDGRVEFVGRNDQQVKIRGFRIELGEIETVLNTHPQVGKAVVIVREDIPGDKRLVAYVVSEIEKGPASNALRHFLRKKIPDYMVPSVFMEIGEFPLTPNGKVDREALPEPEQNRPDVGRYVAPETESEKRVAEIWSSLLQCEQIGVHDNFFELGGHSLLATQVISRIRDTINVELPLRILFQKPTVAELAERIEMMRIELQENHPTSTASGGHRERLIL